MEPADRQQPLGDWPEGVWLARLYAEAYGIPLPAALDLVFGGPPAGGWISGGCLADPEE